MSFVMRFVSSRNFADRPVWLSSPKPVEPGGIVRCVDRGVLDGPVPEVIADKQRGSALRGGAERICIYDERALPSVSGGRSW